MSTEKRSDFDKLMDQLERNPSQDKFHLYRNLSLGCAAVCLVIITQILSIGLKSEALNLALLACAVSIPLASGAAGFLEYYIVLGPKSYSHKAEEVPKALWGFLFISSGIAMFVALAASLYHLLPLAAYIFGASALLVIIIAFIFHWHLARWYFSRSRSKSAQAENA